MVFTALRYEFIIPPAPSSHYALVLTTPVLMFRPSGANLFPSYAPQPDMKLVDGVGGPGPGIRVGPDIEPSDVISGPKPGRQGGQNV